MRNRSGAGRNEGRSARRALAEALEPRRLLSAALLKDINLDTPGSAAQQYTALGDEVLFVANDGTSLGAALWKTDGTAAGTSLLKPPILDSGSLSVTLMPAISQDVALFWGSSELYGKELWRTDGTVAGTYLVKDINPGPASSPKSSGSSSGGSSDPDRPVIIGGVLYFQANDGAHGLELWRSDGTPGGTYMVKDIWPGTTQSSIAFQVAVDGILYFAAGDSTGSNKKLFRSDGTEAGTYALSDTSFIAPRDLAAKGDELYFFALAPGSTTHHILYRSSGTEAGTVAVSSPLYLGGSSNPATGGSPFSGMTAVGDSVYFKADDGVNGSELWKSDAAGVTSMVKNIGAGNLGSSPLNLTDVNGVLYFTTAGNTRTLWKSDGTEAGTVPVPGAARGVGGSSGTPLAVLNGVVFYAGVDPVTSAYELWRSDGTEAGSYALTDDFWTNNIWPQHITAIGGSIYFTNPTITQGTEPWKSDGTVAGTMQILDLNATQSIGSAPRDFASFGNVAYFTATRGETGRELWRTDGTATGTYLVKDINPGRGSSSPISFIEAGGVVYFIASDAAHGQELWRTDGTEAGTYLVKDVQPGPNAGAVPRLAVLNGTLYFSGTDGPYKTQLWKTDGTEAGTVIVKDFSPGGTNWNFIYSPVAYNGQLYFGVGNYTTAELWRTTGTEAGTHKAFGESPPSALYGVDNLRVANNTLFFTTNTHTSDYKLFRSDGTLFNTLRVSAPTGVPADAKGISVVGDKVYFWGIAGGNGYEPHVTDGTAEGSFKLREINPGSASSGNTSIFSPFVAGGDFVYFGAIEGSSGEQLWRTDGTAAGTGRTAGGATVMLPSRAAWLDGRLYFTAIGTSGGYELWSYDEANNAMLLAGDIRPGSSGSSPFQLVAVNGRLVFSANDGAHGEEVWTYRPTTANAGGPYTVAEGGSIVLSGAGADPLGGAIVAHEWDLNYDGLSFGVDATGQSPTFSAAGLNGKTTPPSFRTVALRVTDALGGQAIATRQVQITNVAPTLQPLGGDLYTSVNQYFRPIFAFDDPGTENFTFTAQLDDGTNLSSSYQFGSRQFMVSGYPTTPGSHLMTVTLTDSDGASDTASVMVHIAAAPPAGVIPENSSAGWYQQDGKLYVTQGTIVFTEEADLEELEIVARPLASGWASPRFRGSVRARAVSTINGEIGFDSDSGNVLEVQQVHMNGGVFDFGRNALIVTDQPLAEIDALVKAGRTYANGGIASTDALSSGGLTAVASATAAQVLNLATGQTATWNGRTVDASAVLVRYTYAGDANFDGKINIDDYGRIDGNVSQSGSVFGWFNGDFNYDSKINIDDYGIIDGAINAQGSPL